MGKLTMLQGAVNYYQSLLVISMHLMELLNKIRAIKIIDYIPKMKLYVNLLLILTCISINSQTLLHTNGKAIVNANGDTVSLRAMNLGGWMLIEPYQLQAAGFASAQWEFEDKIEQLLSLIHI